MLESQESSTGPGSTCFRVTPLLIKCLSLFEFFLSMQSNDVSVKGMCR